MLPVYFLRHTSKYNLDINGVKITADVVEITGDKIEADVSELRSRLDFRFPIVGFDLMYTLPEDPDCTSFIVILVLYVRDYCLLVKFDEEESCFSDSLTSFLKDESICFLGCWKKLSDKVSLVLRSSDDVVLKTCATVSILASKVLRNKEIMDKGCDNLEDLATKVAVPFSGEGWSVKEYFKVYENALFL